MSQTATPEAARAHARAQAATTHLGPADDPRRPPPSTCRRASIRPPWSGTRPSAPAGAAARAARSRHPRPPHRPARRRLRERARLLRASPDRAPQRGRHREGAVAGLPRRGVAAALRHGPGAACRSSPTRVERTTRCVVRRTRRATPRSTGTAACTERFPNARDRFAVALAKFGLDRRDIVPNVNFFKHVRVDDDGALRFDGTRSSAGAYVELLAELPVILAIANTPHVLDPRDDYSRHRAPDHRVGRYADDAPPIRSGRRAQKPSVRSRTPKTSGAPIPVIGARTPMTHRDGPRRGRRAACAMGRRGRRGATLQIVDLGGNQAVDCLLYNADDPAERYSAPDTIVEQGNIFLVAGSRLLSNEGRTMMTLTATTCARHDTIGGACSQESNTLRYGFHTQAPARVRRELPPRALVAGHGQARHDVEHQLVHERPGGAPTARSASSTASPRPGSRSTSGPRWTCSVVISNCPQINNPCNGFDPTPIRLVVTR